jgi:hypothetical protein
LLTNKVQATEVQDPFIPLVVLENAIRYWWFVALLIVVGGLGGWFVYSFTPPLYEATAQFSIAIDFVSTGPLTQYEEDLAINTAGNIFISTEVLQRVVEQAGKESMQINLPDLKKQIFIERKFSVWNLRVRDPDPKNAERLALIWMNQGESILRQSYQHAIEAYRLERYLQSQESCIEKFAANGPSYVPCDSAHFADIQKNIHEASVALFTERQAGRGLFAGLTLGPFNPPEVSQKPLSTGLNQYVFLGGLLGLLVSISFIELGAFKIRGMKT